MLPQMNGNEIEDTSYWGAGLGITYAIDNALSLKIGAGFANLSNDAWDVANGKDNYTRWAAFVSMPYKVTSNFTIAPEAGYYNYGDIVGQDTTGIESRAGDEWLIGVNFQFLF